jgi:hypothetical protein
MPLLYFTKSLASEGPYVKKPSHRHVRVLAVANLIETLRYKAESLIPDGVIGVFIYLILPAAWYWPRPSL